MRGVSRRRGFCVTTERDVRHRPAPDLVNRAFVVTDINQLWVAITAWRSSSRSLFGGHT